MAIITVFKLVENKLSKIDILMAMRDLIKGSTANFCKYIVCVESEKTASLRMNMSHLISSASSLVTDFGNLNSIKNFCKLPSSQDHPAVAYIAALWPRGSALASV